LVCWDAVLDGTGDTVVGVALAWLVIMLEETFCCVGVANETLESNVAVARVFEETELEFDAPTVEVFEIELEFDTEVALSRALSTELELDAPLTVNAESICHSVRALTMTPANLKSPNAWLGAVQVSVRFALGFASECEMVVFAGKVLH
jgi:hypothetical protein